MRQTSATSMSELRPEQRRQVPGAEVAHPRGRRRGRTELSIQTHVSAVIIAKSAFPVVCAPDDGMRPLGRHRSRKQGKWLSQRALRVRMRDRAFSESSSPFSGNCPGRELVSIRDWSVDSGGGLLADVPTPKLGARLVAVRPNRRGLFLRRTTA